MRPTSFHPPLLASGPTVIRRFWGEASDKEKLQITTFLKGNSHLSGRVPVFEKHGGIVFFLIRYWDAFRHKSVISAGCKFRSSALGVSYAKLLEALDLDLGQPNITQTPPARLPSPEKPAKPRVITISGKVYKVRS